jgi:2OG-Fe(II) oxygenase superfamily
VVHGGGSWWYSGFRSALTQLLHVAGLTVAMFHDEASGQQVPSPDDKAGLYVRTHSGQEVKVVAEADHLLFQAGETLQVVSNGLLRATEHCVVPPECADSPTLSRSVFVVFCQPKYVTAVQEGTYLFLAACIQICIVSNSALLACQRRICEGRLRVGALILRRARCNRSKHRWQHGDTKPKHMECASF